MAKMKEWINLLRMRQWYKNLVVFLPIFFVEHLFRGEEFSLTFWGLVVLCFVSSANYIINDLVDLKVDRLHPEKKERPLAAGRIGKVKAVMMVILLLAAALLMAEGLGKGFFWIIIGVFVLSQAYSFFLKRIVIVDVLVIAVLFVLRAVSGAYLIEVEVSPWLILCPFFLSLFLSIGKRQAELGLMGKEAVQTRKVLKEYNIGLTNSLMVVSTTLLVISYALYSFLSIHQKLIYTLPFALWVVFRYLYLVNKGSEVARQPEKVIKDKQMMIGIVLWVLITIRLIYY